MATISDERKGVYYLGTALLVIGGLLFFSTFITFAMNFGNFNNFDAMARSGALRAFSGMGLLILGGILQGIGRMGAAGAGIVIDPEQMREDLKPWNEMQGGMINDTLSKVEVVQKIADKLGSGAQTQVKTQEVIKVRCPSCHALNDESDKFCGQCGKAL